VKKFSENTYKLDFLLINMHYAKRKRGTMEIMLEILKSCEDQCGITKVIYGAGVNYLVAQKYVDQLVKIGALNVKIDGERKYYVITEKGKILKGHIEQFLKLRQDLDEVRSKVLELLR